MDDPKIFSDSLLAIRKQFPGISLSHVMDRLRISHLEVDKAGQLTIPYLHTFPNAQVPPPPSLPEIKITSTPWWSSDA